MATTDNDPVIKALAEVSARVEAAIGDCAKSGAEASAARDFETFQQLNAASGRLLAIRERALALSEEWRAHIKASQAGTSRTEPNFGAISSSVPKIAQKPGRFEFLRDRVTKSHGSSDSEVAKIPRGNETNPTHKKPQYAVMGSQQIDASTWSELTVQVITLAVNQLGENEIWARFGGYRPTFLKKSREDCISPHYITSTLWVDTTHNAKTHLAFARHVCRDVTGLELSGPV